MFFVVVVVVFFFIREKYLFKQIQTSAIEFNKNARVCLKILVTS